MFEQVREFVQQQLSEAGLASLAVAVVRDGQLLWEEAFGWADREHRVAATADTSYSVASVTKPITASALMALVERGLIDLDAPIDAYLGETKLRAHLFDARQATVRRVASHAAGLPTHHNLFYADEPRQRPPMSESIRRYGQLSQHPGEGYIYSNLGYGLLDDVISRVSGSSYETFLRDEVFAPLGMSHAAIGPPPGLENACAVRYSPNGNALPTYDMDHRGGSAAYCSAHDLARFMQLHLKALRHDQSAVLSNSAIEAMQAPLTPMHARGAYGLGWSIRYDDHGYRSVAHGGEMSGVSTLLKLIPSERLGLAVLVNGETRMHFDVGRKILGELLPEYAARDAAPAGERALESDAPACDLPDEVLGRWAGEIETYAGSRRLELHLEGDGQIWAALEDGPRQPLDNPRYQACALSGVLRGDLGTEDAAGHDVLKLSLRLQDGGLAGCLLATFPPGRDLRLRNGLCHWASLRRT